MTHALANAVDFICWLIVIPVAAYLGYRTYEGSDNRRGLLLKWIVSAVLIAILEAIIHMGGNPYTPIFLLFPAIILGILWAPSIGSLLARPLTSAFDGGQAEGEPKPFYFMAEGKRRQGHYEEAVAEVRKQLQLFPGDYEGYMKLASIQMENLNDLPAAQATLNEYLALPDRSPNEVISVLHLLADWQLQYGRDAQGSIKYLQRIVTFFPGTPAAHAAEQRIAHLGQADETNKARREGKFTVKPGEKDIGLRASSLPASSTADPLARAEEIVKHLEQHPSDTEAREKLAVLYAEEFQRVDLAADQLEQLIALPAESPKHVAHWLNLLATLQVRHGRNVEGAERAVRRIIEKFPGGALAAIATSRLATLQAEMKAGHTTARKVMGTYEKNVGLKLSQ